MALLRRNLSSRLSVERDAVSILYVVDKAEIPTFPEFGATAPTCDAQAAYLDATVLVRGLLVALGLGAVHALSPGHGKTIVAACLVGARGTAQHVLFLGLTVTITHTRGVFSLGLVSLYASRYILPETLTRGVVSGILVAMEIMLVRERLRTLCAHGGGAAHGDGHGAIPPHHHAFAEAAEARQWSQKALALGTHDALLYYHAGMIAHANSDRALAKQHLERARTINPYFSLRYAPILATTLAELK